MFFKSKYELAQYGEEFSKSYIVLKLLDKNQILKFNREVAKAAKELDKGDEDDIEKTLDTSEEIMDRMYEVVTAQFVEGQIFEGEADRPMKKEDIESFPPAVIKDLNQFIQGSFEKKV